MGFRKAVILGGLATATALQNKGCSDDQKVQAASVHVAETAYVAAEPGKATQKFNKFKAAVGANATYATGATVSLAAVGAYLVDVFVGKTLIVKGALRFLLRPPSDEVKPSEGANDGEVAHPGMKDGDVLSIAAFPKNVMALIGEAGGNQRFLAHLWVYVGSLCLFLVMLSALVAVIAKAVKKPMCQQVNKKCKFCIGSEVVVGTVAAAGGIVGPLFLNGDKEKGEFNFLPDPPAGDKGTKKTWY